MRCFGKCLLNKHANNDDRVFNGVDCLRAESDFLKHC